MNVQLTVTCNLCKDHRILLKAQLTEYVSAIFSQGLAVASGWEHANVHAGQPPNVNLDVKQLNAPKIVVPAPGFRLPQA